MQGLRPLPASILSFLPLTDIPIISKTSQGDKQFIRMKCLTLWIDYRNFATPNVIKAIY